MEAEMGLKINFPDHIIGGFWADGFWPSGTTPLSWMTPLKDTGSWEGESRLGVSQKSVAKSGDVWPQIARLTDHPQKWACTFWNLLALRIPKSTGSFLWDVCEPSNSRLKSIDFSENTPKIHWFWRIWIQKKNPRNWPVAKGFFHFFLHNITFEDPLSQFLKKLLRDIELFFLSDKFPLMSTSRDWVLEEQLYPNIKHFFVSFT